MKKSIKSLIALLLIVLTLMSITSMASAATYTYAVGSPTMGKSVTVTTKTTSTKVKPVYESQTQHTKGIATTVTLSRSVTESYSVSASVTSTFGAEFCGMTASASVQVGCSLSQSRTVSTSQSYTVSANTASGKYRIEVVFPTIKCTVRCQKWDGRTNYSYDKTTSFYLPKTNSSYVRFVRYAD